MGAPHLVLEDLQAGSGFCPGRVGGDVRRHFQPGDVIPVLDDEIRHVGGAVVVEQDFPAAQQFGLLPDVEQAPDVVVAVVRLHPQLAFRDVFAAGVILLLRHAQGAGALVQQVAEHRNAWGGAAVDGGDKDFQGGHGFTSRIRSMMTLPALMPSAAQASAPTVL